jgi:hypothetical protein
MRGLIVALGLGTLIAIAPTFADAQAGAIGAIAVGEPLALWLTGLALLGVSYLRRGQ